MKKSILFIFLGMLFVCSKQEIFAQSCGTRQLDTRVASFLQLIGYQDMTLEQLRTIPINQIKYAGPPLMPYPKEDVSRIKITADSIPVLIFNPAHA